MTVPADDRPEPEASPISEKARRRAAKLFNERLKLAATFLNTLGIAGFIAAVIVPYVNREPGNPLPPVGIGIGALLVVHLLAQSVLSAWKSEE